MVTKSSVATAASPITPPQGRLAVLTGFAVAAAAVPVPVLPARLLARVRGAIVHDIVSRHGLSLTTDARKILADPGEGHATLRKAAETVALELLRRLRALGSVAAAVRGLEVYALGHLLDRYITTVRRTGTIRIHADEARKIRELITRAIARTLSPSLTPAAALLPAAGEDLRDEFTRWVDTLLLGSASAPDYLKRRLSAAFDDIVRSSSTGD
ncbi:hypothetical protein [Chondromyces crocatus]|uniref:Uncharacterized protein n=1 Tax=Chondromyces crocatus TaxID=52 RepID=A0A0K1E5W4_CHOCO|nr:hypothetical protein [Chondromyces crocatus]AKT36271.1 uncharacterized protein CMC5_003850 [Chondromyces crocatus]